MNKTNLRTDLPISSIEQDELEYCRFAYNIACVISGIKTQETSYAIGICGKWGDGKTSVYRLIKHYFKRIEKYGELDFIEINKKSDTNITTNNKKRISFFNPKYLCKLTGIIFIFLLCILTGYISAIKHIEFINSNALLVYCILISGTICGILYLIYKSQERGFSLFKELWEEFIKRPEIQEEEQTPIIEFRAWDCNSAQDIQKAFFKQLSRHLDRSNNHCFVQIAQALNIYSKTIFGKEFIFDRLFEENSIEDTKEKINDLLQTKCKDKKVIIVIDNIDRLLPDEILTIFKLVRATADFSNFIYILCYDRVKIVKLLNQKFNIDADEYIKKIIQTEKNLPVITDANLKKIFTNELQKILTSEKYTPFASQLNILLEKAVLNKYIKNLRDLKRFLTVFEYNYTVYRNENLNIYDITGISVIETFCSELYSLIKENKKIFCNGYFEDILDYPQVKNNEEIITLLFHPQSSNSNLLSTPNKDLSEKDQKIKQLKIMTTNIDTTNDGYRRIFNIKFFENYFKADLNKENITYEERESLINNLNNTEVFCNNFYRIYQDSAPKISDFLAYLDTDYNKANNTKENNLLLLKAFLSVSQKDAQYYNFANEQLIAIYNIVSAKCTKEEILSAIKGALNNISNFPYGFIYLLCRTTRFPVSNPPVLTHKETQCLNQITDELQKNYHYQIDTDNLTACSRAYDCLEFLKEHLNSKDMVSQITDTLLEEENSEKLLKVLMTAKASINNNEAKKIADFFRSLEKTDIFKARLIDLYNNKDIMQNQEFFVNMHYEDIHIINLLLSEILGLDDFVTNNNMISFFNQEFQTSHNINIDKLRTILDYIKQTTESYTESEIEIIKQLFVYKETYKDKYKQIIAGHKSFVEKNLSEHIKTIELFENLVSA